MFFDEHDSHFDNGVLRKIMWENIQPFVLKSGDSINGQPNDNGPDAKLKSFYNLLKSVRML